MIPNKKFVIAKLLRNAEITKQNNHLYREIKTTTMTAASAAANTNHQQLIGPAVKLLLFHYNLGTDNVQNRTGPKNNILKSDVLGHIKSMKLTPIKRHSDSKTTKLNLKKEVNAANTIAPEVQKNSLGKQRQRHIDIEMNNMRRTISKRLTQSKSTIPHAYVTATIQADKLQAMREKLSNLANLKFSMTDFIVNACAQALQTCPEVNVQWQNDSVRHVPTVDISIAVATPNGLITPILFNANKLGISRIASSTRELAARAREGKLLPQEFQGGTFTISNLGMFGSVTNFTAIINPPQAAILAVGGLVKRVETTGLKQSSQFDVTLCYDGRAIQDYDAHRFMQIFQLLMAEPNALATGFTDFEMATTDLDLDYYDDGKEEKNKSGSHITTADTEEIKRMAKLFYYDGKNPD